jgi:hypothetical protein
MRFPFLFNVLASMALVGCTAAREPSDAAAGHACTSPRPQVCTMIWAPVCADHRDGSRSTHASACNACADDTVTGYRDGACEDGEA